MTCLVVALSFYKKWIIFSEGPAENRKYFVIISVLDSRCATYIFMLGGWGWGYICVLNEKESMLPSHLLVIDAHSFVLQTRLACFGLTIFIWHICFKAADFNVQAAQQGIIYLDEVDKITKKVFISPAFSFQILLIFFKKNLIMTSCCPFVAVAI